ncbi:MAG: cysteine desulfurase / selenocysteine lyase [Deltaproteobacteria bacterium]|nr:cysteine desulfurase / selenocysteine lyase [Deltaproteobacteria bacterium]
MKEKIIYFDNAATSFPKPEEVTKAMVHFSREIGASPGRSGHRLAVEAGRIVFGARERISQLFGGKDSSRVVFGLNATEGINQGLKGLLRHGDHLITSSMEHNSVMRPLRALMKEGLAVSILPCSQEGFLDPSGVKKAIRQNTRMVVLNHASNVVGTIQPLAEEGGNGEPFRAGRTPGFPARPVRERDSEYRRAGRTSGRAGIRNKGRD